MGNVMVVEEDSEKTTTVLREPNCTYTRTCNYATMDGIDVGF